MTKPRFSTVLLAIATLGLGAFAGAVAMGAFLYHDNFNHTLQHLLHGHFGHGTAQPVAAEGSEIVSNPVFLNWQPVRSKRTPDWLVRRGFDVELIADGFDHPVAIAALPAGRIRTHEPWLYLAEDKGRIRWFAADGTTDTFCEALVPGDGKSHTNALAVDAQSGDLIASVWVPDEKGTARTRVLRVKTTDDGREAGEITTIAEFPANANNARRLGGIVQGKDGRWIAAAWNLSHLTQQAAADDPGGKLFAFDGNPVVSWDDPKHRPEVFATGTRAVGGLAFHPENGALYAVETGAKIDRLFRVEPGQDYCWNGAPDSMRTNALYCWGPEHQIAPSALVFLDRPVLGEGTALRGLIAADGDRGAIRPTLVEFSLDPKTQLITGNPEPIAEFASESRGAFAGVAVGANGVFVATYDIDSPTTNGRLWRIFPSKETLELPEANAEALAKLTPEKRGAVYFAQNCSSCHRVAGVGGTEGPDLTHAAKQLNNRLNHKNYESMLQSLLKSNDPYQETQRERYQAVLQAKGDERPRVWLKNHLEEPRFDHPFAKMPSFAQTLPAEKRADIMEYVLGRK